MWRELRKLSLELKAVIREETPAPHRQLTLHQAAQEDPFRKF
jgi:hypothetical protein